MTQPPQGQYPPPQHPQGYPPPGYAQQPYAQPMQVQQVGMSVTKLAWTIGQILAVFFTFGVAWPFIWLKRRGKTTVTRHR
jgi:hypothetical protein